MKGVVIAGTGSGVGKTMITTGLLSMLSKRYEVQAYKVGPDFIDPMYHTAVTGRASRNLDSFLMPRNAIRRLAGHSSKGADICVVEGVRGLYEGLTGTTEECSTAEMAKILGFPVILVMNARSLTRSAAAIVNGLMGFDDELNIKGVILNNVSGPSHERKLREAIERYTDAEIIGMVGKSEHVIEERRLGLTTEGLFDNGTMSRIEDTVSGLDIDRILDIAESNDIELPDAPLYTERSSGVKVAVPMDDAYCFYYRENIECMEASGASVKTFRPADGEPLPDADMYYLGGGYPELHAHRLSENTDFTDALKNACAEGKVILGECGGLMSMCGSMTSNGMKVKMSGILDADAFVTGRRHGPSYVIARSNSSNPLFEGTVRGHEFHYSEVVLHSGCGTGFIMERGEGICGGTDGAVSNNAVGTYMHQHALSSRDWFGAMVKRIWSS